MIHPAKLGQFIGSVLVVLNSWNASVRVGIVGTKLHFYCMKVEAVQREMCGKFGLNPLDPVRPDINVPCSMSGSTVVLQIQSLFVFFYNVPCVPVTFVEEDLFRFRARATFRARPRVQIG